MRRRRRSPCPLACGLDLLGDPWSLLVVRDAFAGKSHFSEFRASPEKIATNILSDRLARLCDAEILTQRPSELFPGRQAYELTARGRALFPILKALADWALAELEGTKALIEVEAPEPPSKKARRKKKGPD